MRPAPQRGPARGRTGAAGGGPLRLKSSTVKNAVLAVTSFLIGCAACGTVLIARGIHHGGEEHGWESLIPAGARPGMLRAQVEVAPMLHDGGGPKPVKARWDDGEARAAVPSRPLHAEGGATGTQQSGHHLRQVAVDVAPPSVQRRQQPLSVSENANAGQNELSSPRSVLDGVRVLVAIASYDFAQIPHLEEVLDAYHDLCAAGSYVHVVIHTTVPYPVALIDLLNTRLTCVNPSPDAGMKVTIVLKSPGMRLNLVDCHRTLFYEKIDEYDLFIYTEDDIRVTPKTVSAYLSETDRVRKLIGGDPLAASDFNVGIVRYEYNYPPDIVIDDKTRGATENVTRVYWEHSSNHIVPKAVDRAQHDSLEGEYVSMGNHHQGMFLATRELLKYWKERGPACQFDVIRQRPGLKNKQSQPAEGTQRVWMSSHMLYGGRHCNVKQVLPIDRFGALTVLHLPNKNYRRVGKKGRVGGYKEGAKEVEFADGTETFEGADPSLLTAMQLHIALRKNFPRKSPGRYEGIAMVDEIDRGMFVKGKREYLASVDQRIRAFNEYAARGGVMTEKDMNDPRW